MRFAVFLGALTAAALPAWGSEPQPTAKERELLAVLRSDAPPADKAITCKELAIHGSSAAVPELARLLPNPQLHSWARIALEAIPGPAADAALRSATESLEGRLLIGTINSIGVRRDARAVDLLTAHLQDQDAEVASAAAAALGHIGNADATKSLRAALAGDRLPVRSAVASGLVLCAERLVAEEKSAEAVAIYDEVRKAELPQQRIIEATRGAILARHDEGIPLLIELFRSPDKRMFQLALSTAREFPGEKVDQALADEISRATPDRGALIIGAMADRPETVVLSAVLAAAGQGPKPVRIAAIRALGRVGEVSCLSPLMEIALDADAELAQSAKDALAVLPGEDVDVQIVAMLPEAKGKNYQLLLLLVGQRRIDAVGEVLKALDHSDPAVRGAAFVALGESVDLEGLSVLISQVLSPKHAEDAAVAQQALKTASVRMPDREACAAKLAMALERSPVATKSNLLEILAEVGGATALQAVGAAAKSDDPQLQDTGSRLLGKWNSVDAAPVLLDLARTAPEKYQIRALRGYIGLARKFAMSPRQRAEMCQTAFDTARRLDEQKLVLEVVQIHPSAATLQVAVKAMEVPELKTEATQAALVIAQRIGSRGGNVTQLLRKAGLDKVKLEIVKAEYGAGSTQKDVTAVLRKSAGDLPLITLPSATYNASFGGDPAPGVPKKLTIQYRINGKAGEAQFAENAVIILPVPR